MTAWIRKTQRRLRKVRKLVGPLDRNNTKEFLHLIEENEKLHMPRRPKMAKTPYEVTEETAREVRKVTQLVCDVGDMLGHLPRPELVTAALMELQAAVESVVHGQVTK
jgi:hypothetical protein